MGNPPRPRIDDLERIEVEHLLGQKSGPLVKLRAIGEKTILLGEVAPAEARQIAEHLWTAAARAEYESDLWAGLTETGMSKADAGQVLFLVREGERRRHES